MITRDQVNHEEDQTYTAFASDLGWPVGMWPTQTPTDLGEGTQLIRQKFQMKEGSVEAAIYTQQNGVKVKVYND